MDSAMSCKFSVEKNGTLLQEFSQALGRRKRRRLPPERMDQKLKRAPFAHGGMFIGLTVVPGAARIGTVSHLLDKARAVGIQATTQPVGRTEDVGRRTVITDNRNRPVGCSLKQTTFMGTRFLEHVLRALIKGGVEMESDVMPIGGDTLYCGQAVSRQRIVKLGPQQHKICRCQAKSPLLLGHCDRSRKREIDIVTDDQVPRLRVGIGKAARFKTALAQGADQGAIGSR